MAPMRRTGLAGVAGTVAGILACVMTWAMTWAPPCEAKPLNVVVTVKPVHALVAGIMGGEGRPVLLVEGAQSPHTFSLRPSAAAAIANADLFIRVSPAVEPFTAKLMETLPDTVTRLTLAEAPGVSVLPLRTSGTFEPHEHGHEAAGHEGHDHGGPDAGHDDEAGIDGHIWLDPKNAVAMVDAIEVALSARAPDSAPLFKANAATIKSSIEALQNEIAAEFAPVKDKPFVVFHDAYQYLERRFGLSGVGSITVSPDVRPSANRLAAVRNKIADLGAVCVFAEPGFQPSLVAAVTEGTKARTATLDPEGLGIEAGPQAYVELMRALAHNMAQCLRG